MIRNLWTLPFKEFWKNSTLNHALAIALKLVGTNRHFKESICM